MSEAALRPRREAVLAGKLRKAGHGPRSVRRAPRSGRGFAVPMPSTRLGRGVLGGCSRRFVELADEGLGRHLYRLADRRTRIVTGVDRLRLDPVDDEAGRET